jgi:alkaline phosphatase D
VSGPDVSGPKVTRQGVSRRRFLGLTAGVGLAAASARLDRGVGPLLVRRGEQPALASRPFTLGVASGDPLPGGVVLWTRLAPDPQAVGGGMPSSPVSVGWEVAHDEAFRRVAKRGTAVAEPDAAHSVHVDARGLEPGRDYFYRFRVGDHESEIGRTRTAPAVDASPSRLRFAFASCQDYQHGFYGAHRHLAAEDGLAAVLWLGDYIYEGGVRDGAPRTHEGSEILDLDAYRRRYGTYKSDLDLQSAHQAHPWIVTWDDHEVDNNYADDLAQRDEQSPDEFLLRRAAAYRAWWEHQPVRLPAPTSSDYKIYRRSSFGDLLTVHTLDTRQYRSDQPCGSSVDIGAPCSDVDAEDATLLGVAQRRWLFDGLIEGTARWDVLAQQTMFAPVSFSPDLGNPLVNLDQWDGYRRERASVLKMLAVEPRNPVVVTGDIHSSWAHDLEAETSDRSGTRVETVATEFVGTSITSSFPFAEVVTVAIGSQPTVKYFEGDRHGYVVGDVTRAELRADFRYVRSIETPDTGVDTGASFVVEDRNPGAQEA